MIRLIGSQEPNKSKKGVPSEDPRGVRESLPPLSKVADIFYDLTSKACNLGLPRVITAIGSQPLRVATMCSGTESPLLALQMIKDSLVAMGHTSLALEHVFSAEIEAFKQAYIERNFQPPAIFRDIVEITHSTDDNATTAYGSRVPIPANVDIVIAGTSCVDFSGLNRQKKGLDDRGESGDTFTAVLSYAKKFRPSMLILENVYGAPWDDMLARYQAVGYASGGVLVDTKEYYLPQTRQRGYMVCVNTEKFTNAGDIVNSWVENMRSFKRHASSPISSFMLPSDDASVVLARERIANQSMLNAASLKDVEWTLSEQRHAKYRLNHKLGNAKPCTDWEPSGKLVTYDYADRAWHKKQVERVWDFEDCAVLRKARDYDVQFKTRVWDVSQNIDRFIDTPPFGISSCLTPSGIFFVTDRGGPLTFAESLGLQGLPVEKLHFTTETERQIQDLAGNAMSTPVVGAALLSGLLAANDQPENDVPQAMLEGHEESSKTMTEQLAGSEMLRQVSTIASNVKVDVAQMVNHANASGRRCYCEGQITTTEVPIQLCADCGHTTCATCGEKPLHNYLSLNSCSREAPESFIKKWRPVLPMLVRIHPVVALDRFLEKEMAKCSSQLDRGYRDVVKAAVSSPFTFSYFKRSSDWTVIYQAPNASLVLTIEENGLHWALFATPDRSLPGNHSLRLFLQQPIAKSSASKNDFLCGSWSWRIPHDINFDIDITAKGEMLPSWKARLCLPGEAEGVIPQIIQVNVEGEPDLQRDISGKYEHLRNCGTACEALYKSEDENPIYLFLDPTRLGDPKKDTFVFSENPERLQYDETRCVIASVESKWRPWTKPEEGKVWSVEGKTDSHWVSVQETYLRIEEPELVIYAQDSQSLVSHSECLRPLALTRCVFESEECPPQRFLGLQQISVDDKEFFNTFAWALEPLRAQIHAVCDGEHDVSSGDASLCHKCTPALPEIKWTLRNYGQDKKVFMHPYEDPASATAYEIALKARPDVFVISSDIEKAKHPLAKFKYKITVAFNSITLAQRAYAKLQRMTTGRHLSTTWSLDTEFFNFSRASLPPFSLSGNDSDELFSIKLPTKNIQPWDKQRQSLAWMRRQEAAEGKEMVVEVAEEAILPHLGWRAEARSAASLHVRGGILADHPGFGKTITSLSLIHAEFTEHAYDHEAIIANMKDLPDDGTRSPIKLAATLVLCPGTLTTQWQKEVTKVLGEGYSKTTIVINNVNQLKTWSIETFKQARIIIVDRAILGRESYLKRLAAFAGLSDPGNGSKKREFKAWLDLAIQKAREHAHILQENGVSSLRKFVEENLQNTLKNSTMRSFATKRLKGRRYVANAKNKEGSDALPDGKEPGDALPKDSDMNKFVLFEMFRFNRIIVDEFSYVLDNDNGSMTSITGLMADKRWALSATPPLKDPYDVAQLARIIGINLPSGINMPGVLSANNIEAIQENMTSVELFDTFRAAPSNALVGHVHRLAQTFLNGFVRQNIMQHDHMPYEDFIVPINLNLDHALVYNEQSQRFNSQDMRVKKRSEKQAKGDDREERIYESTKTKVGAEQALSREATFFSPSALKKHENGLDALLRKRCSEYYNFRAELRTALEVGQIQILTSDSSSDNFPLTDWEKSSLDENYLRDHDITKIIQKMVAAAKVAAAQKIAEEVAKAKDAAAQDAATQDAATESAKKFAAASRNVRCVKNAKTLQEAEEDDEQTCNSEGCVGHVSPFDVAVSTACGHKICEECFDVSQKGVGICGAPGCGSSVRRMHLLWVKRMGADSGSLDDDDRGKKIETVIALLNQIQLKHEQAVLFVQAEDHVGRMVEALEKEDISCIVNKKGTSVGIDEFQEDTSPSKTTVIILDATDESAAGTNLTNANHVIFLSSLLKQDQYGYESQMAQAIGRIRRPGQSRDIYAYRMVALHTIDVDVLEHRERINKVLVEMPTEDEVMFDPEQFENGVMPFHQSETTTDVPERAQLIRDTDGRFKLVPKSMLLYRDESVNTISIDGRNRAKGFGDYCSLVKFSKAYSDDL
ncbi:hypothetical protein BDV97DRAFT_287275 [Delphinella strobiligena]|nr:hypothetical protein BDV97DRAFT_287275 [Delphinella strobiligena]